MNPWLSAILIGVDLAILAALVAVIIALLDQKKHLLEHRSEIVAIIKAGEAQRSTMLAETHVVATNMLAVTTNIATEMRDEGRYRHDRLHERLSAIEQRLGLEERLQTIDAVTKDTNIKVTHATEGTHGPNGLDPKP
jgi:hypothetical protein